MAKQRYILDFDDKLKPEFMANGNGTNLVKGINESGTDEPLNTAAGGSGNDTFVQGQTIIFDGQKLASSGVGPVPGSSGPPVNDDRYYTKTQIDAFFASLALAGGFPVAYANITGAPAAGVQFAFLTTPIQIYAGRTIMADPVQFFMDEADGGPVPSTQTAIAALVTCTCEISGPDSGPAAKIITMATLTSPAVDVGWFRAAGGSDSVAGCDGTTIQVDISSQSFYYQQTSNSVSPSNIVFTLVGYIYVGS